jgi:hypothetical protein
MVAPFSCGVCKTAAKLFEEQSVESDYDLTPDQWEALKALRAPARLASSRFALEQLVALQLAAMDDGRPVMTSMGRKVLVRGSSRLLDLVA